MGRVHTNHLNETADLNFKHMKRHEALQPLSREHHHGLLLCWKIRTGLSKSIAPERIKAYSDWFCENYLQTHFHNEEKLIFPILGEKNEMVKKALAEHRRLMRLFADREEIEKSLNRIEEELERHIRFEERILFPKVQEAATSEQMAFIAAVHDEKAFVDNTDDEFWR